MLIDHCHRVSTHLQSINIIIIIIIIIKGRLCGVVEVWRDTVWQGAHWTYVLALIKTVKLLFPYAALTGWSL